MSHVNLAHSMFLPTHLLKELVLSFSSNLKQLDLSDCPMVSLK